ncbi:MAG: transcription elongation factor GreA [Armatimonadetes bacterium]|jgi:transcription elongation factor GreA|nr:transcription elongation factor GreA [Armatimonadota bacterium]
MQKQKEILLTAEGYRLFEEELNRLTTVTRQEVRARVRDTKPTSDEGDDAAYDSAKVEQALVEGRIQELREILTRARILSEDEIRTDEVQLGSRVLVTNLTTGRQVNLKLVSPLEAAPERSQISTESPVGEALVGRQPGEVVDVRTPAGVAQYRIEQITV